MTATELVRLFLMFVVVPLWGTAGLADWWCHRRADLPETSGPGESGIHLLMLAEVTIPVLMGMFLEIDASVIVCMVAFFCLHRLTMRWDVRYAERYRVVTRTERRVHNALELLPLLGIVCVVYLHHGQVLALFGAGTEPARWVLEPKRDKLPGAYLAVMLFNLVVLELLPYAVELLEGLQRNRTRT